MATKARLHWFWRGTIAAIAGVMVSGVWCWLWLQQNSRFPVVGRMTYTVFDRLEPSIGADVARIAIQGVACGTPTVLTAFGVYWLLTRWLGGSHADGELHCRKCGYILRGISEPRCPECGEPI
jgi:hypothetical protein